MADKPKAQTKAARVYEKLRRELLAGTFDDGRRLTEVELAGRFGVARGTVREALLRLETEGLLADRGPYGGRFIEDETRESVVARHELREAIEGLAARLAAMNMTGRQSTRLRELADAVSDSGGNGDRDRRGRANLAFCRFLVGNCGNPLLARVYDTQRLAPGICRTEEHEAQMTSLVPPARHGEALHAICDAIDAHDPDGAERVVRGRIAPVTEGLREAIFAEDENWAGSLGSETHAGASSH